MAGDTSLTRLLLGLGLRSFSMHPAQILAVKQEVLRADTADLARVALARALVPQEEGRAQRPRPMPRSAPSRCLQLAPGSSAQWQISDSKPDTRPNRPIAAEWERRTRRVSSE